ncbi:hypothetical protein BV898_12115 [Hypsibius exemplaris]|uniref:Uncharacterized protein n=1 Tax=Hypsibius exemplaris TaxID=2072580 RepID=A0A1W0WEK4_HYPEX|nr:hypothetical protein BV898_12115 [Hypsibius exemplaris]
MQPWPDVVEQDWTENAAWWTSVLTREPLSALNTKKDMIFWIDLFDQTQTNISENGRLSFLQPLRTKFVVPLRSQFLVVLPHRQATPILRLSPLDITSEWKLDAGSDCQRGNRTATTPAFWRTNKINRTMFAVIGFVYALRLLMFQSVSGTITGCTQRVTSSDRLGAVVETACHQGDWPTEDSTAIDLRTRELSLHEILLPRQYEEATSVPPLPFLPRLTHLHFDHIVSSFSNQSFPLQTVTRLLDRSRLLQLVLQRLRVPVVDATFFTGFTGLETLKFHDCEIYDFHPNAFGAFISCLPERLPPDSRLLNKKGSCSSSLTFLVMAGLKMQTFSWDVLAPISASLEPPLQPASSLADCKDFGYNSNINLRSIPQP